jgi:hypothetical protein
VYETAYVHPDGTFVSTSLLQEVGISRSCTVTGRWDLVGEMFVFRADYTDQSSVLPIGYVGTNRVLSVDEKHFVYISEPMGTTVCCWRVGCTPSNAFRGEGEAASIGGGVAAAEAYQSQQELLQEWQRQNEDLPEGTR